MKRQYIIAALVLIVISLIGLGIWNLVIFHLTSSTPANRSANTPTYQIISFSFNKSLSAAQNTNTVIIGPAEVGQTEVKGNTVSFIPTNQLTAGQTYTVTVSNITSKTGQHLRPVLITFKAIYVPFSQLPASLQKSYIQRQDSGFEANTPLNHLKDALPHQTSLYSLSYLGGSNTFVVQVLTSDVNTAEAAARTYIQSFGVDPSTINIYYSVPAVYSGRPGP